MGVGCRTGWVVLLAAGCAHAPTDANAADALAVMEVAARYALEHDVPPVLREPSAVCLEVDGQPPPPQLLSRLSGGGVQVSVGASDCSGPLAILVQLRDVVVSGERATAYAGVRLGRSGPLSLQKVNGAWHVIPPPGPANVGPRLSVPIGQ